MRLLSARLIIALVIGVTLVSLCSAGYQVWAGKRSMKRDLQRRAEILGESLAGNVDQDIQNNALHTLQKTIQRFAHPETLIGLAIYDLNGRVIAVADTLAQQMETAPPVVTQALR